jgi:hypothetical protein
MPPSSDSAELRGDPDKRAILEKTVTHVTKHGKALEHAIAAREKQNPTFSFLQPGGESWHYYQFRLEWYAHAENSLALFCFAYALLLQPRPARCASGLSVPH